MRDIFSMFRFSRNHTYSIGVDMSDEMVKMVQLGDDDEGMSLIAGGSENRPAHVKPGSGNWQRWAVEALKRLTANGKFRGKGVTATMPASEVFIGHVKVPKIRERFPNAGKAAWAANALGIHRKGQAEGNENLQETILSKVRLPFDAKEAVIKYIPTEEDNVLVLATERKKIDRHLAVYEKANLQIKSMAVWPVALANSYTRFFGRRKTDIEAIVMLLELEPNCTNVVICRHQNLLFARSVPIGLRQLGSAPEPDKKRPANSNEEMVSKLVQELTACIQHFASMNRKVQIERLIFLSGQGGNRDIFATIAKQLEMPAQVGDCLAAVKIADPQGSGIDRRDCQFSWATAFGLSLS